MLFLRKENRTLKTLSGYLSIMEENFINETIDTSTLPKFEEVQLLPLHPNYWKVIVFNSIITYTILGIGAGTIIYFIEEIQPYTYYILGLYLLFISISFTISKISFKTRGYAFRDYDVIYKSGAIAINTDIIPYNRVQHAALHEGFIARKYGLAAIEIFTAGGAHSDIKIPGIEKEQAEKIKQLLMGKIVNQN